ncbi:hypothetical protein [Faecalibacterium prausnitzii]|uniref:DNA-binding protein n=1 Tax=Faecalibacterium prausnitzii TaxID=853 RepID=A0A2A7AM51_9FIRM|nr:hypothetical protein [Faecalibacterium prausnitzii]PDX80189.1 hypothetical protein CGS58_13285 [Faecalibacterium prausnitzii]
MAKSNRSEAWHASYKAIFEKIGCIRLTLEQVSVCMGIPARYVRKRYPYGWANMSGDKGKGRGNTIRLDTLLDQEFGTY